MDPNPWVSGCYIIGFCVVKLANGIGGLEASESSFGSLCLGDAGPAGIESARISELFEGCVQ